MFSTLAAVPYYQDATTTLYHGRCEDVLGQLVAESVALVLGDLPYGSTRNDWDREIDPKMLWWHFHRLCPERAPQILFGSGLFSAKTITANEEEYRYRQTAQCAVLQGGGEAPCPAVRPDFSPSAPNTSSLGRR